MSNEYEFLRAQADAIEARQKRNAVVDEIAAERRRQTEVEGWTPAHDDQHVDGAMATAAACYAVDQGTKSSPPKAWPWHRSWWKPKDRRRDLIRAAALLVAEIERIDRAMIAAAEKP
jgi:hypothetical protein